MTHKCVKMELKIPVKFRAGNQVVREELQTQKRHKKVNRKAGKKTPGQQTIWDESPLGIAMGFVLLISIPQTFCQGVRRGATRNQHVRGT